MKKHSRRKLKWQMCCNSNDDDDDDDDLGILLLLLALSSASRYEVQFGVVEADLPSNR